LKAARALPTALASNLAKERTYSGTASSNRTLNFSRAHGMQGLTTDHFEHVFGAGFSAGIDSFCVLADNYYSAGPDQLIFDPPPV
jgi:Zn-dependent oligopeptidase